MKKVLAIVSFVLMIGTSCFAGIIIDKTFDDIGGGQGGMNCPYGV